MNTEKSTSSLCCKYCGVIKDNHDLFSCSRCKTILYCSGECQKMDWKEHKNKCTEHSNLAQNIATNNIKEFPKEKVDPDKLSEEELKILVTIIKSKFIDIFYMISKVDNQKAEYFRKRNYAYYIQMESPNKPHVEFPLIYRGKFFIPEKELSPIETSINEIIQPGKVLVYLPEILNKIGKNFDNLKKKGISEGLEFNNQIDKELIFKIMLDETNAFLIREAFERQRKLEISLTQEPYLFAHPRGIQQKSKLNQLSPNAIKAIIEEGCAIFCFENLRGYEKIFDILDLLSMEGRFDVDVSRGVMHTRFAFHTENIAIPELKLLHTLCENIQLLPYELNLKTNTTNLQISDSFVIRYFPKSPKNNYFSDSGYEKEDSGIKYTFIFPISEINARGVRLDLRSSGKEEKIEKSVELGKGKACVLASRDFEYSFCEVSGGKVFYVQYFMYGGL